MAEKSVKKAVGVVKWASTILKGIKKEYQKELQKNVRSNMAITTSAKKASKTYKEKFGATPTTRWHNALKQASSGTIKKTTTKATKTKKVAAKKVVKAAPKMAPKPILAKKTAAKPKKTATKTAIKPILPKVAKPKKVAVKKVAKAMPKIAPEPIVAPAPAVMPKSIITPKPIVANKPATKAPKTKVKFNIDNYVEKDGNGRIMLKCIYNDAEKKVAVATNAHILVYSKDLYNPKYADKAIAAYDIWKGDDRGRIKDRHIEYAKGSIVEGKYPNWKAVIPDNKLAIKINVQKLYDFCNDCESSIKNGIKKINEEIDQRLRNGEPKYIVGGHITAKTTIDLSRIYLTHNNVVLAGYRLSFFKDFLVAMLFLGSDTIYFDAKASNIKPIISYNQNGGVLLMPILIGLDNNVGLSYKDWEAEKNSGKIEYGFRKFDVYFKYNI